MNVELTWDARVSRVSAATIFHITRERSAERDGFRDETTPSCACAAGLSRLPMLILRRHTHREK